MRTGEQWLWALVIVVVGTVVCALVIGGFRQAAQNDDIHNQKFQACIEHGGSWVADSCINTFKP